MRNDNHTSHEEAINLFDSNKMYSNGDKFQITVVNHTRMMMETAT